MIPYVIFGTLVLMFDLIRPPRRAAVITVVCLLAMLINFYVGLGLFIAHTCAAVYSAHKCWQIRTRRVPISNPAMRALAITSLIRWQQRLLGHPHA